MLFDLTQFNTLVCVCAAATPAATTAATPAATCISELIFPCPCMKFDDRIAQLMPLHCVLSSCKKVNLPSHVTQYNCYLTRASCKTSTASLQNNGCCPASGMCIVPHTVMHSESPLTQVFLLSVSCHVICPCHFASTICFLTSHDLPGQQAVLADVLHMSCRSHKQGRKM